MALPEKPPRPSPLSEDEKFFLDRLLQCNPPRAELCVLMVELPRYRQYFWHELLRRGIQVDDVFYLLSHLRGDWLARLSDELWQLPLDPDDLADVIERFSHLREEAADRLLGVSGIVRNDLLHVVIKKVPSRASAAAHILLGQEPGKKDLAIIWEYVSALRGQVRKVRAAHRERQELRKRLRLAAQAHRTTAHSAHSK